MISDKLRADDPMDYTVGYLSCKEFTGSGNAYTYYGSFDTVMKEFSSTSLLRYRQKNENQINRDFWDYYLLRLFDAMISCRSSYQDSVYASAVHYFTPPGH
jgi:hypothetical protein